MACIQILEGNLEKVSLASLQFTKEIEENGKIPLVNCLVTHENNTLRTTVYRKPTHTDRLLDQWSYNLTSHKVTTVQTLRRIVCDSHDGLTGETNHLNPVFIENNYSTDFIEHNTYVRPNESSNNSYATTATIPYIRWTESVAHFSGLQSPRYITPGLKPFSLKEV